MEVKQPFLIHKNGNGTGRGWCDRMCSPLFQSKFFYRAVPKLHAVKNSTKIDISLYKNWMIMYKPKIIQRCLGATKISSYQRPSWRFAEGCGSFHYYSTMPSGIMTAMLCYAMLCYGWQRKCSSSCRDGVSEDLSKWSRLSAPQKSALIQSYSLRPRQPLF